MTAFASYSHLPLLQSLTLERKRLLEKLNLAVHHKLTMLIAPPGYGKTTLATQFAHQAALPVAWHSIEKREQDVPNLFEHAIHALSPIVPEILKIKRHPRSTPVELAVHVTDCLRNSAKSDIVYILDDIHHLVGSPGAELWLRALMTSIAPTCHLILLGRIPLAPSIIEMISRREILAIGQDDLRFNFQEINDLAEKAGKKLASSEIYKLASHLEGWPAGTILTLQPLPDDLKDMIFDGNPGPEALFSSLANLMLKEQPSKLRDFLLVSSTLSRMTPASCHAALGLKDSVKHLKDAHKRNLFISEISGGLIYHPLFREFLQQQLQENNPEQFKQLHVRAGRWFEGNNRLDEGFEHYIASQQWENASAIAERSAQTYLSQGKAETIIKWSDQLAQSGVESPRLNYTCAMIYSDRYQFEDASARLADAVHIFQERDDKDSLIQATLLEATIHNLRGQYREAISKAEPLARTSSIPDNLRGYALNVLGTAYLYLGDTIVALQWLEKSLPLLQSVGDTYALSVLLQSLDVAYTRLGRFNEAAACLQEVVSIRRSFGKGAGLAIALNNLGYHYHLLGAYELASQFFEEGLAIITQIPETRSETYLLWSMGDLQRDRGDFDKADSLYRRALQLTQGNNPSVQSNILISMATLHRWKGDNDEAISLAQDALLLANHHNLAVEKLRAEACIGVVQAQLDKPELAGQKLERIAEDFRKREVQTRFVHTLGLLAYTALLNSDEGTAHQYLTRALEAVNHPANLQPLIAELAFTPVLKTHVLSYPNRYQVLIKEIHKLEDARLEDVLSGQDQEKLDVDRTYSLQIWILGDERVERDAEPVSTSAWRTATARELFYYLLLKGAASRDQIGLEFWPESSSQQVRQQFHTTLHRLRNAVGANVILFEDDLYFINPSIDVWCDVYEFESASREARLTSPLTAHTEALWRRAVEHYKGDFLVSYDSQWIEAYRETLHQQYLDSLIALGKCIRVRGNPHEAIVTLKRALHLDPYREDTHRALITCYADLGERILIHRQLNELSHLLHTELGITPSTETLELVHALAS